MKTLTLLTLLALAACSNMGTPNSNSADNSPQPQTQSANSTGHPCAPEDLRRGVCY